MTLRAYPNLDSTIMQLEFGQAKDQVLRRLANYIPKSMPVPVGTTYERGTRCCERDSWVYTVCPSDLSFSTLSSRSWSSSSSSASVHVHTGSSHPETETERKDRKEKEEFNFLLAAGITFGVVAIAMSFFVGLEARTWVSTSEDEGIWKEFVTKFSVQKKLPDVNEFFAEQRQHAQIRLAFKVALFCAAAIGALGALFASYALMTAGLAIGVTAVCLLLANWGFNYGQEEKYAEKAAHLHARLSWVQ